MQVPEVSKEMVLGSGAGVSAALKRWNSLVLFQGLGKKNNTAEKRHQKVGCRCTVFC